MGWADVTKGITDSCGNVFADLGLGPDAADTAHPEVAEAIRSSFARARANVVQWLDDPRVQDYLRRSHAEMKAKASHLTTPPST